MKKLLLILTLGLIMLTGFSPDDDMKPGEADSPSGFIDITVSSNIDKQFFQYNLMQKCLSVSEETETGKAGIFRIIIPVKEFECFNRSAYDDFVTLLKAEQYPFLEINILRYPGIKYDIGETVILKGVSITAAGVSNRYDINCTIEKADNKNQLLNGAIRIRLTDFAIVPPVKLLGLIKVKDEVIINFEFCLE